MTDREGDHEATASPPPGAHPPAARFANEDATTILGIAAHELKNAMGGIGVVLARCEQRLLAGQPVTREHVDAARAELRRLSELVNGFLDGARPGARGPQPPAPEPVSPTAVFDLGALALEVVEVFEQTHGRAVARAIPAGPTPIAAWPEQVRAVLVNYLENAARYAPPPAELRVALGPSPRCPAALRLSVADTGPGIHPDDQPRLFDKFFRARSSGQDAPGLGLGLYICRSIGEAHGGRVGVESVPGHGATFWLDLPRL
jgi:signal transduction histidine kinase